MSSKLGSVVLFELKRNIVYNKTWVSNAIFLIVNISIFPFLGYLNDFFLGALISSIILTVVLTTSNVFDEDMNDGSIEQYIVSGLSFYQIYLSKIIISCIEFILVISIALPLAGLFYSISLDILYKIWGVIVVFVPSLVTISVFGAMLTVNLRRNSIIAILLVFPLLISILILLSLATNSIVETVDFSKALVYIELNIGILFLLLPLMAWLSRHLISK
jgi:heme exporter protein B